eukprot:4363909-Amphidinium_carterae.1
MCPRIYTCVEIGALFCSSSVKCLRILRFVLGLDCSKVLLLACSQEYLGQREYETPTVTAAQAVAAFYQAQHGTSLASWSTALLSHVIDIFGDLGVAELSLLLASPLTLEAPPPP